MNIGDGSGGQDRKLPRFLRRLLLNGAQHYPEGLQRIRLQTTNAFSLTFLAVLGFVTLIRLFAGQYENVAINSATFVAVLFAQVVIAKGKLNLGVAIAATSITFTCFILHMHTDIEGTRIIPQLALCMVLSLMLFDCIRYRLGFLAFGVGLLLLVGHNADGNWLFASLFAIQMLAFALLFLVYVYFFEAQDAKIQRSLNQLKKMNEERDAANRELNERNQELIVFSNIMSHDLKQPLSSIIGHADLLEMNIEESALDDQTETVREISKAAISMNALITDMLTYSKVSLQETSVQRVDLNEVVREVIANSDYQIRKDKVQIEAQDLPVVDGNHGLYKALIHNLITNAIKYQPKDRPAHRPRIRLWSESDAAHIRVFIEDNGIGIDSSYLPDLFTPFKRFHTEEDYGGTGLGMSICLSIVEKYQGTIKVVHSSERGTTFELTFPQPEPA